MTFKKVFVKSRKHFLKIQILRIKHKSTKAGEELLPVLKWLLFSFVFYFNKNKELIIPI